MRLGPKLHILRILRFVFLKKISKQSSIAMHHQAATEIPQNHHTPEYTSQYTPNIITDLLSPVSHESRHWRPTHRTRRQAVHGRRHRRLVVVVKRRGVPSGRHHGVARRPRLPRALQRVVHGQPVVLVEGVAHVGRLVVEDGDAHEALGGVRHVGRLQLGGQLAFPLVAAVLEPDLDLGFGEVEAGREARAFRGGEVAFHVEGGFQLEYLKEKGKKK